MTSPARLEDPHLEDPRLDARDHQTLADWWCAALGQVSEDTWTTGPRA